MRVLLVHPSVRENAAPCNLPLGLAYCAGSLKRLGIDYHVLDLNVARLAHDVDWLLAQTVKHGQFTHVGISAIVTQFTQVERCVKIVRGISPEMPIIVGGPISALGEKLHEWLGVCAYQGEAEGPNGFGAMLASKGYRNPAYCVSEPVDIHEIPPPDWRSFSDRYFQNPVGWLNTNKWRGGNPDKKVPRSINMSWARGCPFNCTFCARGLALPYRKRSPRAIVREMEFLAGNFQVRHWHTSDDNSVLDTAWLRKVCEEIKQTPALSGCTWSCAGRADCIDVDILEVMRDAGCRLVGIGVESGSQKVLDSYNKGLKVEDNERAILACKQVFGAANYTLMVGSSAEDDESIRETIGLCRRTETRPEAVFFATPLPGSELYEQAKGRGLIPDELSYVRSLGEMGMFARVNMTLQGNDWLRLAQARILIETSQFGGAI